jgi:virginiamycin B lyase
VITQHYTGVANSRPLAITSASDGNLWFTEEFLSATGRITTAGVVTEYSDNASWPTAGIAESKTGRIWVTGGPGGAGSFAPTAPSALTWTVPQNTTGYTTVMTRGPDGNLWTIEAVGGTVDRITESGVVTRFSVVPSVGGTIGLAALLSIVTGPDGDLWFTEGANNAIGSISPDGLSKWNFPVPTAVSGVDGITVGPDGNLWFTESVSGRIGRITLAGVITEFTLPGPTGQLIGITTGPDGNLWITEGSGGNAIRRFTR